MQKKDTLNPLVWRVTCSKQNIIFRVIFGYGATKSPSGDYNHSDQLRLSDPRPTVAMAQNHVFLLKHEHVLNALLGVEIGRTAWSLGRSDVHHPQTGKNNLGFDLPHPTSIWMSSEFGSIETWDEFLAMLLMCAVVESKPFVAEEKHLGYYYQKYYKKAWA